MVALPTVANSRLTDFFGVARYNDIHRGLDIAGVSPGTTPEINAVEGGTVIFVNRKFAGKNGSNIGIQTSGGGVWYYGHIEGIKVRVGQKVREGQHIATMGKNGLSATAGIHLHLELWWGDRWQDAVDPLPYLLKNGIRFHDFDGDGKMDRGERFLGPLLAPVANIIQKEDTLSKAEVDQILDGVKVLVDAAEARILSKVGYEVQSYRNEGVDPRDAFGMTAKSAKFADTVDGKFPSRAPGADPKKEWPLVDHLLSTNGRVYKIDSTVDSLSAKLDHVLELLETTVATPAREEESK